MTTGSTTSIAQGTFKVTSMEEDAYQTLGGGRKLTRARGGQEFTGDIGGEGHVEWLMCYRPDGSARFVGHQLMRASLSGRSGTFVIEATGDFDGASSKGDWRIVEGSGTEQLEGMTGSGSFEAASGTTVSYRLNYELI